MFQITYTLLIRPKPRYITETPIKESHPVSKTQRHTMQILIRQRENRTKRGYRLSQSNESSLIEAVITVPSLRMGLREQNQNIKGPGPGVSWRGHRVPTPTTQRLILKDTNSRNGLSLPKDSFTSTIWSPRKDIIFLLLIDPGAYFM